MLKRLAAHLSMQPFDPRYPSALLEGMNTDTIFRYHLDEFLVDVV